ncbi:hypothetical protein [Priestia flexa]|uniref:hypothetical protein n=1 Tax=Priestia flexa TaxID=86664 RepID=UPI0004743B84|nr:hypothetical protein [Priestia flexa]
MIHKLSPVLGSRSEVLDTPIDEALEHMYLLKQTEEAKQKEKEYERYIHFKSMVHSHPIDKDNHRAWQARQKFEDSIRPKEEVRELKQSDMKWDFEEKGGN